MASRRGGYQRAMTTTTLSSPAEALRSKAVVALAILAVFTAYSLWVIAGHGFTGLLSLVGSEPWAMQLLLDLVLACSFGIGWMRSDAKRHGLASWPFIVATLLAGSIGLLGYVAWRGVRRAPGA